MNKILVIDDIQTNLLLIKSILIKHFPSFKILLADSGKEGLLMAREEKPETILLDIFMPEIDGFEVCRLLKNDENTRSIPVLMVSAYGDNTDVRIKGLNVGADAFISKPFNNSELVAMVNVMLRIKHSEDLLRVQNKALQSTIFKLQEAEKAQKKNLRKINQYQKKLRLLNATLLESEEKERKTIAGFLHDGIGQTLSIANMKLTSLLNNEMSETLEKAIGETSNLINNAIAETRLLTYDLSPPILYELGLIPAIKWKLEQISSKSKVPIQTEFISHVDQIVLDPEVSILVFRILSELLINVLKHAEASKTSISIKNLKKNYYISVVDNGKGFDTKQSNEFNRQSGYGLFSIVERMESINGKFKIKSKTGKGTHAVLVIPVKS